jgi:hypothetical protein
VYETVKSGEVMGLLSNANPGSQGSIGGAPPLPDPGPTPVELVIPPIPPLPLIPAPPAPPEPGPMPPLPPSPPLPEGEDEPGEVHARGSAERRTKRVERAFREGKGMARSRISKKRRRRKGLLRFTQEGGDR